MKFYLLQIMIIALILTAFPSCQRGISWEPGRPLSREKLKVAVIHTNRIDADSVFDFAHHIGIFEMQRNISLPDSRIIRRINVHDADLTAAELAMRDSIVEGANIIIATSWGHMEVSERLALEFPSVVFAQINGYRHNDHNFTTHSVRLYQARFLAGIAAGLKTQTGKIGYVAAWGTENSQVTSGINAFARGVAKVNPDARVYVWVTGNWFDPMGENHAANTLIAFGCDVIAQHSNTTAPQIAAQRAGVWGIGANVDMSIYAPDAVITSVIPQWGALYTRLVKDVIDGTFCTTPRFCGIAEGMVDITPVNARFVPPEIEAALQAARQRIIDGSFHVFQGVLETNDGRFIGEEGEIFSDYVIHSGMDWYYWNVVVKR